MSDPTKLPVRPKLFESDGSASGDLMMYMEDLFTQGLRVGCWKSNVSGLRLMQHEFRTHMLDESAQPMKERVTTLLDQAAKFRPNPPDAAFQKAQVMLKMQVANYRIIEKYYQELVKYRLKSQEQMEQ